MKNFSVLFVCMGNICRSPTAHGVFKRKLMDAGLAERVKVDSAGTHNFHPGSPPDARSQVHAAKRGYDLSDLRAFQINNKDYANHAEATLDIADYIVNFCNAVRLHSTLGNLSHVAFKHQSTSKKLIKLSEIT